MPFRSWTRLLLVGFVLSLWEVSLNADEKDVAFPELPKGAGKVDKEAARTFTATKSGLKYRILRKGEGAKPRGTDAVKVNYHGWLDNGKVFDSSYRRGEPISFPLNRVIKGGTEGMQLVGAGGMIELEIPADLGYGDRGAPPDIGPGATLHFLVELLGDPETPYPELPTGAGKIDKDAPKTFTTTKSELKYRILRKGGDKKPKATDNVTVKYHGWLDGGKVFDSSYKRREPATFPLDRVIKGWTEGLQLAGEGGMIELEIPAELGYGDRGAPPDIEPGATLHFLVELIEVE
jgi:FKBP-type peptidyl-prolyl cis-trans isomerase